MQIRERRGLRFSRLEALPLAFVASPRILLFPSHARKKEETARSLPAKQKLYFCCLIERVRGIANMVLPLFLGQVL